MGQRVQKQVNVCPILWLQLQCFFNTDYADMVMVRLLMVRWFSKTCKQKGTEKSVAMATKGGLECGPPAAI